MDYPVLYICAESRENCFKYEKHIKPHAVLKETWIILGMMQEFYKTYPAVSKVDWEVFSTFVLVEQSKRLTEESILKLKLVLDKAASYKPHMTHEMVVKGLIEQDYATRLMEECDKLQTGTGSLEEVHDLATTALRDVERFVDKDDLFVSLELEAQAEKLSSTGYEWRLPVLNRSIGPLRTSNFILVAARVEVGKTTFLASEASYIAPQLPKDRPIVWVNNEEESSTVFFRVVQSALGLKSSEMIANPKEATEKYIKLMGTKDKILITKDTNTIKDLEALFKEVNPGMIIFDVLDKVIGSKTEDAEHIALGKTYKWARELARTYGPVIAASQVSALAVDLKDPPFIGMDALRGSRTDKPGEADAIITIGKYKEPKTPSEEMLRTINVPKNKLPGGGSKHIEAERHGQYIVSIDPQRARYE